MEEKETVEVEQIVEQVVEPERQEAKPKEQFKDNSQEVNMAKLRAAKLKAEQERAELAAKLEELQSRQQQSEYGDDDFVEGKHLKKEMEAVKKELESYKMQQKAMSDEMRLKQTYNDFESVVNNENLEKLKELDPDTAETIATSNASVYARGATAYKRIKELTMVDKFQQEKAKTQANASKPRPMNSVSPQQGESPLSMANAFANGLTEDIKKQLWKEMQECSKRL